MTGNSLVLKGYPILLSLLLLGACQSESVNKFAIKAEVLIAAEGMTLINADSFPYKKATLMLRQQGHTAGYLAVVLSELEARTWPTQGATLLGKNVR